MALRFIRVGAAAMNKLIRRFWNGVLFAGRDDIRDIKLSLALLLIKDEIIMATLQEVKDAVAAEAAGCQRRTAGKGRRRGRARVRRPLR